MNAGGVCMEGWIVALPVVVWFLLMKERSWSACCMGYLLAALRMGIIEWMADSVEDMAKTVLVSV
jgi:hypothetical protein